MIAPQIVAVWLNEDSTRHKVQLYRDDKVPDGSQGMPDEIRGKFLELNDLEALLMEAASERQLILNRTQIMYSFVFSATTREFTATKTP